MLSAGYAGSLVLRNICLGVDAGEVVAVIGSNGAGKTTLLRALSGLIHPVAGNVRFCGREIGGLRAYQIARLGVRHVPEGRQIFTDQTVEENLLLGAYDRRDLRVVREDLEHIFSRFPILLERRSQLAGFLSGGEQQVLAIARALMGRPKLLLLDEPSLGLSPTWVKNVQEVIKAVNYEGVSILWVEQMVHTALSLASRGYIIQEGRIVSEGPAGDLLAKLQAGGFYFANV
ncbi:MAG: ABC transporter ATP-binding protein [Clostridia bacterium]|nr:MAG: ABC transporter ATP-binding protein [Clostridia bacterium]